MARVVEQVVGDIPILATVVFVQQITNEVLLFDTEAIDININLILSEMVSKVRLLALL